MNGWIIMNGLKKQCKIYKMYDYYVLETLLRNFQISTRCAKKMLADINKGVILKEEDIEQLCIE